MRHATQPGPPVSPCRGRAFSQESVMDERSSHFASVRLWLSTHPYSAISALTLLATLGPFLFRTDPEWEDVFIGAARHLRGGQDLYGPGSAYLYPPFMAWALLPV